MGQDWLSALESERGSMERASASAKVAEALRTRIIEGDLQPGTRLSEERICTALGVSRNTLREALIQLEREGLIYNIASFDAALDRACSLLDDDSVAARWAEKRDAYMADMVNLTDVIVDLATNPDGPSAVEGLSRDDAPAYRRETRPIEH